MFDPATRPSLMKFRKHYVNSYYRNTPYWAKRKANRERGLCDCGKERAPGVKKCHVCREKSRQYSKNTRLKRKGVICFICKAPLGAKSKSRCERCLERERLAYWRNPQERIVKVRQYAHALRADVLRAYGGACVCCGEETEVFLCIDHVNNDGKEHRREIGGAGSRIYRWLKSRGYPPGFQLLCFNCNMGKQIHGECPHKTGVVTDVQRAIKSHAG